MHCGSPKRREREKSRENIRWNNGWKLPKFDERHEINIQKAQRPQKKWIQRYTHWDIIIKLSKDQNKKSWKQQERGDSSNTRELQFDYKISHQKQALKLRGSAIQNAKTNKQKKTCQARILDPEKLSFKSEEEIKI